MLNNTIRYFQFNILYSFIINKRISFLLGIVLLILLIIFIHKINILKIDSKKFFGAIFMYTYMYILFSDITGIPQIRDIISIMNFGMNKSNINIIPLSDGITFEFILNIILFIPFGFIISFLGDGNPGIKKVMIYGFLLSLFIEISQIFTYRASDINDIISNSIGSIIGYIFYSIFFKKDIRKNSYNNMVLCIVFSVAFIMSFTR